MKLQVDQEADVSNLNLSTLELTTAWPSPLPVERNNPTLRRRSHLVW